jgi:NIPSNAP.
MIVEMRTYRVSPGTRAAMIALIKERIFPELQRLDVKCAGPWPSAEDAVTLFWMRGFADMNARETLSNAFYGGSAWQEEIADLIMPNLDEYKAVAVEVPEGAVCWED